MINEGMPDIEHWGSAPGPRAPLIVGRAEWANRLCHGPSSSLQQAMDNLQPNTALQSLITETGSHVTLGTPCVAAEEIPVTDEMMAAAARFGSGAQFARHIYRAMAAVAPVELYGPNERRLEAERNAALARLAVTEAHNDSLNDAQQVRITALEAENAEWAVRCHAKTLELQRDEDDWREIVDAKDAHIAALEAKLTTFGPVTPADLPAPPRRADGTLAPAAKPWTPPKAAGDAWRVGS